MESQRRRPQSHCCSALGWGGVLQREASCGSARDRLELSTFHRCPHPPETGFARRWVDPGCSRPQPSPEESAAVLGTGGRWFQMRTNLLSPLFLRKQSFLKWAASLTLTINLLFRRMVTGPHKLQRKKHCSRLESTFKQTISRTFPQ